MTGFLMKVVERRHVPNDSPTGYYREEVLECGHVKTCYANHAVYEHRVCYVCKRASELADSTTPTTTP